MQKTIMRAWSVLLCTALAIPGCATTAAGTRVASGNASAAGSRTRTVLVDYLQKLPPGTLVKVDRVAGRSLRGTLMKATDQSVFIQPKTRIPEGILEVPLDEVIGVTPERSHGGGGVGRAIAAGVAAGAGGCVAVLLILIAVASD